MRELTKYKKPMIDMALNIFATAVPVFFLQLIILPQIASYFDDDSYGLVVTLLALLNVVPSTIGNALNNVRLIFFTSKENENCNFSLLTLLLCFASSVITIVATIYYSSSINIIDIVLILIVSILWLYQEYYIVAFRLKIDYIGILLCNVALVIGYGIGYLLFIHTLKWQYIYIIGRGLSIVYICLKTDIWKEKPILGKGFKQLFGQTTLLILSNVLARITTYADKLLIFPILGGAIVSVYYAATLFGKVVSMAITPISSVMLTYLTKYSRKNDALFRNTFIVGVIVSIFGYLFCILISRPVLGLLYPQFVDSAMNYILLTTGTMVLTSLASLINPFVLKFFDMKWQVVINFIYVIVYITLSMTLLHFMGLFGFCIGSLIATILKLIAMLLIYYRCQSSSQKKEII